MTLKYNNNMKYETISLEFNIKLDKSIYLNNPYQYEFSNFLNHFFIGYLDSDQDILQREEEDKQKKGAKNLFPGLIQTLSTLQDNILQTIHYDLIKVNKNIETIQVQCQFNFYEHNYTLEKFIQFLFDKSIDDNDFMAKHILELSQQNTMSKADKEKANQQINMYEHLGKALKQAKKTIQTSFINESSLKKNLTL